MFLFILGSFIPNTMKILWISKGAIYKNGLIFLLAVGSSKYVIYNFASPLSPDCFTYRGIPNLFVMLFESDSYKFYLN